MGENSAIEWTNHSWNPWYGCHKVSEGCRNCYMYRDMKRYGRDPNAVRRSKTTFRAPLKMAKKARATGERKMVFTCSWSDFFIEEADGWRDEAWEIIRQTPELTYQILTKRPENILRRLPASWGKGWANVWLGVSAENQEMADRCIPYLLQTPAAVRFVSCEPLLGMVDLTMVRDWSGTLDATGANMCDALTGRTYWSDGEPECWTNHIDWVIVGGESGPGARVMHPEWARSLRDQCLSAGTAFFFKQWGAWSPTWIPGISYANREMGYEYGHSFYKVGKKLAGRQLDGKEWNQLPEVQQ